MNLMELFIELGFKADTMKLKEFMRAVGDLNMSSIASAVGLGAMYEATSKIMRIADDAAMSVFGYTQITGESGKEMQQFSAYAEKMGASSQDATGSLKSLQMALLNVQLGRGNGEPFAIMGIDPYKSKNTIDVLEKIQKFVRDPNVEDKFKRLIVSEVGLSESMIQVLKSSQDIRKSMEGESFIVDRLVSTQMRYHGELVELGHEWSIALTEVGGALAPVLTAILRYVEGFVRFITSHKKAVEWIGALIISLAILLPLLNPVSATVEIIAFAIWGIVEAVKFLVHWLGILVEKWKEVSKSMPDMSLGGKSMPDMSLGGIGKSMMGPLGMILPSLSTGRGSSVNTNNNDINFNISGANHPEAIAKVVSEEIQKLFTNRFYDQKASGR
jgi:hypothetical protein